MDDATQVSRNSVPISVPSDRENSVVRQPPTLAQAGELGSAYLPTFCSLSLSLPSSPTGLDSVEPSWISHTVRMMNKKNCRYSDCQFSMTSTPNVDEVTYSPSEIVARPCDTCCWL